jgi:hypothetical protein
VRAYFIGQQSANRSEDIPALLAFLDWEPQRERCRIGTEFGSCRGLWFRSRCRFAMGFRRTLELETSDGVVDDAVWPGALRRSSGLPNNQSTLRKVDHLLVEVQDRVRRDEGRVPFRAVGQVGRDDLCALLLTLLHQDDAFVPARDHQPVPTLKSMGWPRLKQLSDSVPLAGLPA